MELLERIERARLKADKEGDTETALTCRAAYAALVFYQAESENQSAAIQEMLRNHYERNDIGRQHMRGNNCR
jgi:hypothetical protein